MSMRGRATSQPLTARWPLPASATLGSAVRTQRLEREVRTRLSLATRKSLTVGAGAIVLQMEESEREQFEAASAKINQVLERMAALPVLPREAEDILSISARERQRWLKDGRLKSIGTRTVKMRGRSRKVTFQIFDPQDIEDVLDRDMPSLWREQDLQAAADNRRRAAHKAACKRRTNTSANVNERGDRGLDGWDAFADDGLLR